MRSPVHLFEKADIRVIQNTNVRNAVELDSDTSRPHPKRPARVALAVDTRRVQHRRMNHSRPENLHPSGVLAARAAGSMTQRALNVHLGGWLSEREVAWSEARSRLAEELLRETRQRHLQIYDANPLVDRQPLDLGEHGSVRRIKEIAAIDVAGRENSYRRLIHLQRADLDR